MYIKLTKPESSWKIPPEGEQTMYIEKVEAAPRTNPTNITVHFRLADGTRFQNRYDLTKSGGYAAFYYLVTNGCGIAEDELDINDIVGKFVKVLVVHTQGTQPKEDGTLPVFANIKQTLGPGEPFPVEAETATSVETLWF
jgi:hypothetical protein